MIIFDLIKLNRKLNKVIGERDTLKEILEGQLFQTFMKAIEENLSYDRLLKENKRLRKQNKKLKEILKDERLTLKTK
jgi:hypothetical protein